MAIDRLKNPFGSTQVTSGLAPENWAYASAQTGGVTPFTFVGDGTAGTVNGATYRVHEWTYAAGSPGFDITFSQAGIIDLLVCAGGAAGAGVYDTSNTNSGYGGGGGGAGGLILQYSYGVTATTYSVSVGVNGVKESAPSIDTLSRNGGDSVFGSLTAIGGGRSPRGYTSSQGNTGGSGGGGTSGTNTAKAGYAGTPAQGNAGGSAPPVYQTGWTVPSGHNPSGIGYGIVGGGGGGGGYASAGTDGFPNLSDLSLLKGGDGGDGVELRFDGTTRGFAAGGGGGVGVTNATTGSATAGLGGVGGGGAGTIGYQGDGVDATGFGCGGGGSAANVSISYNSRGGDGSPGIVIVRYRIG